MASPTETASTSPVDATTLARYADLVVGFAANVQPGQIVEVRSELTNLALARAIAASAYRHGARFVDVWYLDSHVRRIRLEHAAAETLDFVPSWHRRRVRELGAQRCARIALTPLTTPGLFDDLDPARIARDRFPLLPDYLTIVNEHTTNWTAVVCPSPAWAALVHPELAPDDALARLWEQVLHACRLDEPDPRAAWQTRLAELTQVQRRLTGRRFDALHFRGPGTDLTLGLLPSSSWHSGLSETVDGISHLANVPTEEVYTAPDPARADGVVSATKPLHLKSGALVHGLRVRFERGRAVEIDAEAGAEALRAVCALDEGASRLGEVALVDRSGRVGGLDTVFYTTLLDENAGSHLALGRAYDETVGPDDRKRANDSSIHVDFTIGGDDVSVSGITSDGERVPVLVDGKWRI